MDWQNSSKYVELLSILGSVKCFPSNDTVSLLFEPDYNINTEIFKYTDESKQINISINYPQIIELEDIVLQSNINELIKEAALKPYYVFLDNGNISEGTQWSVKYFIEYANSNIVSVRFEGYIYDNGNAHGTDWVYAINIDLKNAIKITIYDLFNDSFNAKISHQYFKGVDVDTSNADDSAMDEVFERFRNDFVGSYDNFYFGADKFYIILPISNFYRFAADYRDLLDCMKLNNSIWLEIINEI